MPTRDYVVVTVSSRRARKALGELLGYDRQEMTGYVNTNNVLGDRNDYHKIPAARAIEASRIPGVSIRRRPPVRLSPRE